MPELEAAEKRRRSWLDAFLSGSYLNELVTRETLAVDEQVVKRWHAAVLNNIEGLRPMLTPFEGATSRVAGLVASVERGGHTGEVATDEEGGGPDAAEESAQDDSSRHPASSRGRLRNDTINGVPNGERRQLGGNANATWRSILMDAAEGPEKKSDNRRPTKSSPPPPSLSEEEEEEKEEEEEEEEAASAVAAVGSADSYGSDSDNSDAETNRQSRWERTAALLEHEANDEYEAQRLASMQQNLRDEATLRRPGNTAATAAATAMATVRMRLRRRGRRP